MAGRRVSAFTLVALGATLARRGPMAVIALSVSAMTCIALAVVAALLARRGSDAPLHQVPILASSAIAWGGAFLHAVAASASVLRRDRTDGIRDLFVTRTASVRGYLVARACGLGAWLALAVGGGALVVGVVGVVFAGRLVMVTRTAQATAAAIVYGIAFASAVAPIALAALGGRSRPSGYLVLLAVVVAPEALVAMSGDVLSTDIGELCSLPSALAALRSSLGPGTLDLLRFARAVVAVGVFTGVALWLLRREVAVPEAR